MKKMSPIFIVDSIEEQLKFWNSAGFEVEMQVPYQDKIGFAILKCGSMEIMLQSTASVGNDLREIHSKQGAVLFYADVDSLDDCVSSLKDFKIVIPKRKTFYGADEIWGELPSGHVLGLAEF